MSPSCRDETLAGLKVEQAKFGGEKTCLRVSCIRFGTKVKFTLYCMDKFSIKNYFISKIKLRNKILLREISVSTSIFCVKRGFCASPAARADDFTWTNFSRANRAPRLSQVRSQLNGLSRFPCKVKVFFI